MVSADSAWVTVTLLSPTQNTFVVARAMQCHGGHNPNNDSPSRLRPSGSPSVSLGVERLEPEPHVQFDRLEEEPGLRVILVVRDLEAVRHALGVIPADQCLHSYLLEGVSVILPCCAVPGSSRTPPRSVFWQARW